MEVASYPRCWNRRAAVRRISCRESTTASRGIGGHGKQLCAGMPTARRRLFSELLDFPEALPTGLVDRAVVVAAHAETVAVRILHIHFADTPGHVGRKQADDRAALLILLVQRVDIFGEDRHPSAGLALSVFAEENLDLPARDATKRRRIAPVPFLGEAQLVYVIIHRDCEFLDAENWDYALELIHGTNSNGMTVDGSAPKFIKKEGIPTRATNQSSRLTPYGAAGSIVVPTDRSVCNLRLVYNSCFPAPGQCS